MTNTIAIALAAAIVLFLGLDALRYDWSMTVFLGRKGLELTEYLAFWR